MQRVRADQSGNAPGSAVPDVRFATALSKRWCRSCASEVAATPNGVALASARRTWACVNRVMESGFWGWNCTSKMVSDGHAYPNYTP